MKYIKIAWCFVFGHRWDDRARWFGYHDCPRCKLVAKFLYEEHPFTIADWLRWKIWKMRPSVRRFQRGRLHPPRKWVMRRTDTEASEAARKVRAGSMDDY
jgi:hypothetical protein